MTEAQARSLIAGLALVIAAVVAALAWGAAAVLVVIVLGQVFLLWDRIVLLDRVDQALDVADQAVGRVEAVENRLSGLEPPGGGRHAKSSSLHPLPRRNPS